VSTTEVFLMLYVDLRWQYTFSSDNWRPIYSTTDVMINGWNM